MAEISSAGFEFVDDTQEGRDRVRAHISDYRRRKKIQRARDLRQSSAFHNDRQRARRSNQLPSILDVVLHNGNVDPFDTMPAILSHTVAELLSFETNATYACLQRMEYGVTRSESSFAVAWYAGTRAHVHDPLVAHSYLSRAAATLYMTTGDKRYLHTATDFRRKATQQLQTYANGSIDLVRFYRALTVLLFAEDALGDRVSMASHMALLSNLFKANERKLLADPAFDLYELSAVTYQDTQLAVLLMCPTVFDFSPNGWLDQQYQHIWRKTEEIFRPLRAEADAALDRRLEQTIRCAMLETRAVLAAIVLLQQGKLSIRHLPYIDIFARIVFLVGQFVSRVARSTSPVDTCVYLSLIFWLRFCTRVESIMLTGTTRIFKANPTILTRLQGTITDMDVDNNPDQYLWIMFTGAYAESQTDDHEPRWFSDRLRSMLDKAEIGYRTELCDIISRFCCPMHFMGPDPETFFASLREQTGSPT